MSTTICAISTAQGGAIGIVRVSGPEAISIVGSIFSRDLSLVEANRVVYGNIIKPSSCDSKQTDILDEVLVTVFRAPHSYTGEDSVEIACHGSSYILQSVCTLLINKGCQPAQPGEYTQRAYLNGKMDLSQAEAVADLIASNNAAQHRVAMSQMRGGISQKLAQLREKLLTMTSLLELELDFSEEDVEFADRSQLRGLITDIDSEIVRLSSSFAAGNAIKNGIPVAIIGAPNVGKSTLLNRLLNDDRAIVSDIQGTTRDIIEDTITLDGVTFRFIDTAGIRHTDDTIERLGIERSIKAAERAQVIILLTEPGVDYPDITVRDDQTVIRVVNKSDDFQAINGTGIQWLESELLKAAPSAADSEVLITNIRHKQALDLAHLDVVRALDTLNLGLSGDIIAEDLRQCLHHLAEILGTQITTDEVLANIFKNFCIGK